MIPQDLTAGRYRFTLAAKGPMMLPDNMGSTLRGGFGIAFKRMVCYQPQVKSCEGCLLRWQCPYPLVFEPAPPPDAQVLQKHSAVPTAFVIEPPLNRQELEPGILIFDLVLIGRALDFLAYAVLAVQELGRQYGLGRDRVRFDVISVQAVNPFGGEERQVYDAEQPGMIVKQPGISGAEIVAAGDNLPSGSLTLRFLSPTRLKYQKMYVREAPPFHVLFRALLRRVSSLSYFFAGQQWDIDYRGWIEKAQQVHIDDADGRWQDWDRYSTRQQQYMNIGGIVGQVTYKASKDLGTDLKPFLPLLRLGEIIHVGKGTSFGNGRYELIV